MSPPLGAEGEGMGEGGGGRGCPVKRNDAPSSPGGGGYWSSIFGVFGPKKQDKPLSATPGIVTKDPSPGGVQVGGGGGCPVKHDGTSSSSSAGRSFPFAGAASLEEAARHPQSPRPDQTVPLSTLRVVSSIPRGRPDGIPAAGEGEGAGGESKDVKVSGGGGGGSEGCAPAHQPPSSEQWVYPSEQQFYNAMRRKGWSVPDESAIPFVVRIHNAVNERGWAEVRRWESTLHGCDAPRLVRFLGRPNDVSPRAWFNSNILMYRPPFDRHDWYVDRGDGSGPRRYVIDFYEGGDGGGDAKESTEAAPSGVGGADTSRPPAMYLDVRPALDDAGAFADRAKMFVRDAFPGLFAVFKSGSDGGRGGGSASQVAGAGVATSSSAASAMGTSEVRVPEN